MIMGLPMEGFVDPNSKEISADEIVPGLWMGNYGASQSISFLREKEITVIFNCSKHIPFVKSKTTLKYNLYVDDPGPNADATEPNVQAMDRHLLSLTDKIHYWLKRRQKNGNILVHCSAGMQRSGALVMAYLIRYHYKPVFVEGMQKYHRNMPAWALNHVRVEFTQQLWEISDSSSHQTTNELAKEECFNHAYDHIVKKRTRAFSYGQSVNFKIAIWNFIPKVAEYVSTK